MKKYLVAEERENALYIRDIKLAEVKDEEIYVYIDDIDYFETEEEYLAAVEDVDTYVEYLDTYFNYRVHVDID